MLLHGYGSYTPMYFGGYESVMRIHRIPRVNQPQESGKRRTSHSEIITRLCYCSSKRGLPKAKCRTSGYGYYEKSDPEYLLWQQSLHSSLRTGKPST